MIRGPVSPGVWRYLREICVEDVEAMFCIQTMDCRCWVGVLTNIMYVLAMHPHTTATYICPYVSTVRPRMHASSCAVVQSIPTTAIVYNDRLARRVAKVEVRLPQQQLVAPYVSGKLRWIVATVTTSLSCRVYRCRLNQDRQRYPPKGAAIWSDLTNSTPVRSSGTSTERLQLTIADRGIRGAGREHSCASAGLYHTSIMTE